MFGLDGSLVRVVDQQESQLLGCSVCCVEPVMDGLSAEIAPERLAVPCDWTQTGSQIPVSFGHPILILDGR